MKCIGKTDNPEWMREFAEALEHNGRYGVSGSEFVRVSDQAAQWFAQLVRDEADRIEAAQ